jgi:hypothetical protein
VSSTFNAALSGADYSGMIPQPTIIDLIVVAAAQIEYLGSNNFWKANTAYLNPRDLTLIKVYKDWYEKNWPEYKKYGPTPEPNDTYVVLGELLMGKSAIEFNSECRKALTLSLKKQIDGVIWSDLVVKTEEIVGTRNRIINGAMEIDQRNAGASVTPTDGATFSIDRFQTFNLGSATGRHHHRVRRRR